MMQRSTNSTAVKYAGMDRYEARKAMVADLEEQGYLVKSGSTFT